MLFRGEVGERIRHHKGLNIAHECFKGGGQAADMCVYAADDELIAPEVFELFFEWGTHEGGVAPFGEHGIGFGGGEFVEDPGVFVVLQAVAPEVCQQAPVGGVLAGWLGGVVDRDVRRVCRI